MGSQESKKNVKIIKILKKYSTVVIILLIICFIGITLILYSFRQASVISKSIYSYQVDRNADYKIYLKDNNFFEDKCIESGKTYISSLVDNININFNYNYKIDNNVDFTYTYKVVNNVVLKSDYTNTKDGQLWSKEYILINPTTFSVNDKNEFNINQNIGVDYNLYNNTVKKIVDTYNIQATAYMDIKLVVYATSKMNGSTEILSEQSVIDLNMELLKDTFKIKENYKKNDNENKVETQNVETYLNKTLIIVGTAISFISLIGIIIIMNKIAKCREENYYKIKTEKLLNKYEERIARVVKKINISDRQIVDVKNFEQLLEIEDEIRIPILFYETIPNEEGEFIIIYDNIAYRYIIGGRK